MSTKSSKKQPVAGTPTETIPSTSATTLSVIVILQTAKALKLTPGSTSTVGYELGRYFIPNSATDILMGGCSLLSKAALRSLE